MPRTKFDAKLKRNRNKSNLKSRQIECPKPISEQEAIRAVPTIDLFRKVGNFQPPLRNFELYRRGIRAIILFNESHVSPHDQWAVTPFDLNNLLGHWFLGDLKYPELREFAMQYNTRFDFGRGHNSVHHFPYREINQIINLVELVPDGQFELTQKPTVLAKHPRIVQLELEREKFMWGELSISDLID